MLFHRSSARVYLHKIFICYNVDCISFNMFQLQLQALYKCIVRVFYSFLTSLFWLLCVHPHTHIQVFRCERYTQHYGKKKIFSLSWQYWWDDIKHVEQKYFILWLNKINVCWFFNKYFDYVKNIIKWIALNIFLSFLKWKQY